MQLVTNEFLLRIRAGNIAQVDSVFQGVIGAIGLPAALRVIELVVPDQRYMIGGDAGIGLEFRGEQIEAILESDAFLRKYTVLATVSTRRSKPANQRPARQTQRTLLLFPGYGKRLL